MRSLIRRIVESKMFVFCAGLLVCAGAPALQYYGHSPFLRVAWIGVSIMLFWLFVFLHECYRQKALSEKLFGCLAFSHCPSSVLFFLLVLYPFQGVQHVGIRLVAAGVYPILYLLVVAYVGRRAGLPRPPRSQ